MRIVVRVLLHGLLRVGSGLLRWGKWVDNKVTTEDGNANHNEMGRMFKMECGTGRRRSEGLVRRGDHRLLSRGEAEARLNLAIVGRLGLGSFELSSEERVHSCVRGEVGWVVLRRSDILRLQLSLIRELLLLLLMRQLLLLLGLFDALRATE